MRVKTALLAFLLLVAFTPMAQAVGDQPAVNVILISWDGVQREHLNEMLAKDRLPNLAELIKQGALVNIDVTHKTDTKAGHTQMLTGYDPETTGVYSNARFRPIPEGLTIFERLRSALGRDNIRTVMLTGKTHHIGACPPGRQTAKVEPASGNLGRKKAPKAQQKAKISNPYGEPWYLASGQMDVWDGEKARDASVVGPRALRYLNMFARSRFFMFFHFSDPDHVGHRLGENSREVDQSYITCDEWLGEIVNKLKALGIYDKTLIYVNSDHGFDEDKTSHNNAPTVFLATNDKQVVRGGNQRDIVPTILTRMGVDVSGVTPAYPGKSLTIKD